MADVVRILEFIRRSEGGYANRSEDRGGETYAGVSRKWHPKWKGWAIVDKHKPLKNGDKIEDVAMEDALTDFYITEYLAPIKLAKVEHFGVAIMLADWYMTSKKIAVKALQRCLKIDPDGAIGPATLAAINASNGDELRESLKQKRIAFYNKLVADDPTQGIFLEGWLNRVEAVPIE